MFRVAFMTYRRGLWCRLCGRWFCLEQCSCGKRCVRSRRSRCPACLCFVPGTRFLATANDRHRRPVLAAIEGYSQFRPSMRVRPSISMPRAFQDLEGDMDRLHTDTVHHRSSGD
jgi:hypothetical protein